MAARRPSIFRRVFAALRPASPAARKHRPQRREFAAAKLNHLTSSWLTWARPIDHDVYAGLQALIARSRSEAQNNDHVKHFLRLCRVNIVGPPGIRLQMRAKRGNGKPDRTANDLIEEAWRDWGRQGSPDVTGGLSWIGLQNQSVETCARDGAMLLRHVRGWPGNPYGYAVQAIDPTALDVAYNDGAPGNGNRIIMGVELDGWRRPVAYHLLSESHPLLGGALAQERRGGRRIRVPAADIVHVFLPEWVWQTRGIPWAATALLRLWMLSGYEDAEVVAARAAASKMGWLEASEDASTEDYTGDAEDEDGAPIAQFEPGLVEILPKGFKFSGWDPQHPNAVYPQFVKAALRGIASGVGVNYNTLANDLEGVNYTSLRHGMLTERDLWATMQGFFADALCQQVFREWLAVGLLKGAIGAPGKPLPAEKLSTYLRGATWQGRRWQWVDPLKDVAAARAEYDLRTRTISDIIRARGEDPDEVWQEMADDARRLAELGVPPPTASGNAGAGSVPSDDSTPQDGAAKGTEDGTV